MKLFTPFSVPTYIQIDYETTYWLLPPDLPKLPIIQIDNENYLLITPSRPIFK